MPKIFVYDGYPDLKRRVPYAGTGFFEGLEPPRINYKAHDITPDTRPNGVKAFMPQCIRSENVCLPDVVMGKSSDPNELPDIFTLEGYPIVSSRTLKIIESFDPVGHEFLPCKISSCDGSEFRDQEYFYLWIRRLLGFDVMRGASPQKTDVNTPRRFGFLTASPQAALFPAQQPLWSLLFEVGRIFLSAEMFEQFQSAGITGLERYTERGGKFDQKFGRTECVGVVRV